MDTEKGMIEPVGSSDPRHATQFTGLVVTFNEARRLRQCLASIRFCEQLVVIDLGSSDDSVEIAKQVANEVIVHDWVPIAEYVRQKGVDAAHNDWIILLDPDEVLPESLVEKLFEIVNSNTQVGIISVPYDYYFRGRKLQFTVWGGVRPLARVFHKHRVSLQDFVHRPVTPLNGYETMTVEYDGGNAIQHYWVDSFHQLFEKHWRYINLEGRTRYEEGQRFTWRRLLLEPIRAGKYSLIDCRGFRGGPTGVFLSLFWAWYVFMSLWSLRQYELALR